MANLLVRKEGRKGERWPSRRRRSKVWKGISGQMCPNPTHLRRPGRVNRRVKVASASGQWAGRMGSKQGDDVAADISAAKKTSAALEMLRFSAGHIADISLSDISHI